VIEILMAGGWLMVPILICSVLVIAIGIERFWTLNPAKIAPRNQLSDLWGLVQQQQLDADRMKDIRNSSPLGRILVAGLSNARHGRDTMKDSIEEAASQVVHDLERFLTPLSVVATITPLLGLLGTVIGMIKVFNNIMLEGTGNAGLLAGGISQALITTAAGLVVAIPAMILHRYFQRRIDSIVVTMEQESVKLIDAINSERSAPSKAA